MTPHQYIRDINGYDADLKTRDRTVKALAALVWTDNRHVPRDVRLKATQLHDAVLATGRVAGVDDWVREQWARYMVKGSAKAVLAAVLAAMVLLQNHPVAAFVVALAGAYGTWIGTRELRRRRVLRSRKLPKT